MNMPHAIPEADPRGPAVIVRAPGGGERIWFLDNLLTVKASAATGSAFGVLESRLPANSHTPFHRHDAEDEAFYVLEGTLTLYLDEGRTLEAGPGSYVHLPCGVAHGFRTRTAVRMLVVCGTDGFIEMTREAGGPAMRDALPPPAEPDYARLERACARHAIAILGPLPE